MFKLNYRIVESYECLSEMDAATYDREWGNIEGLIELRFGESSIGHMYDGEITPEMYEAGCFQGEWFAIGKTILNIRKVYKNKKVAENVAINLYQRC